MSHNNEDSNSPPRGVTEERTMLRGLEERIFDIVLTAGEPDQWAEWLRAPLELAAALGDVEVMKRLQSVNAHGSALHGAASGGQADIVKELLMGGACPDALDDRERSPLHVACECGHLGTVQVLMDADANVTLADEVGRMALHEAAYFGHEDVAQALLCNGANKDAMDHNEFTPLDAAACIGSLAVVDILLSNGADVHHRGKQDLTALHAASGNGHADVVDALLQSGADRDAVLEASQLSPLHVAASHRHLPVLKVLLAHNANASLCDSSGYTAFHIAAWSGYTEIVDALLLSGCDKDTVDARQETPIHKATREGHLSVVQALAAAGADLELRSQVGTTALHIAASVGNREVAQELLLKGADKQAVDNTGCTPLHYAAREAHVAVLEVLAAPGANVNLRTNDSLRMTPLNFCAGRGKVEMMRSLLRHGADVNPTDQGQSALHSAAWSRTGEAVDLLVEAGANVEQRDPRPNYADRTPLMFAAISCSLGATQALLNHGANANAQDSKGNSPLHLVCQHLLEDAATVVDLLLRSGADETVVDQSGQTPAGVLGILNSATYLHLPLDASYGVEDRERCARARQLLENAPADRTWRRRCVFIVCRIAPDRVRVATAERGLEFSTETDSSKQGDKRVHLAHATDVQAAGTANLHDGHAERAAGATACGGEKEWKDLVKWIVGLPEEGIFRKIVMFL